MQAVWSFWTKPFTTFHSTCWASEKHHLLSWILSVETARRHYPDTVLYTDDYGADLLVDALGLQFGRVSTELNDLANMDAEWWALGKLYAYRAQTVPFVHIDSDVFLWKPLPQRAVTASVFAQNPERFEYGNSCYRPQLWETIINAVGGWFPAEWRWYSERQGDEAVCCGILGGRNVEFIVHYANSAIRMVTHQRNQRAWRLVADRICDNILFEQYLLSACLHYHGTHRDSPFGGIEAEYLFESEEAAFDPCLARVAGYTHLIAGAKRNPQLAERLEVRVRQEYPDLYENAVRHAKRVSNCLGLT